MNAPRERSATSPAVPGGDSPRAPRASWTYRAVYPVCEAVVAALCGIDVEGLERVPPEGRLIVAFNHRSWWDGPLASMSVNRVRYPCSIAKEELFRNPFAAWFLTQVGVVPLDRGKGDVGALRAALSLMEREGCLLMFPEGTRSRTGAPGKAKPGVSFIAHQSGAPVVPARFRDTEFFPSTKRMHLKFGAPLRYHGDGGRESYREFADRVLETIFKL